MLTLGTLVDSLATQEEKWLQKYQSNNTGCLVVCV